EKALVDELAESPHVEIVRVIDPQTEEELDPLPPGTALVVDLRSALSVRVARSASSCDLAGCDVRPPARGLPAPSQRAPRAHRLAGWALPTPLRSTHPWLPGKQIFDIALVVLTAPLWLLVGAVVWTFIRIASPGPAIFRQRRIGRGGEPFVMYKFRTM